MSDNYEKDMALTLEEAITIIKSVSDDKVEISKGHEKTCAFIDKNISLTETLIDLIKSIEKEDYIGGPIPDDKPSERRKKPVWIFKKSWKEMILYIKVKIFITNRKVYVLSLHEDEWR